MSVIGSQTAYGYYIMIYLLLTVHTVHLKHINAVGERCWYCIGKKNKTVSKLLSLN